MLLIIDTHTKYNALHSIVVTNYRYTLNIVHYDLLLLLIGMKLLKCQLMNQLLEKGRARFRLDSHK